MSDSRFSRSLALNWRGPLLAAGIFAALFAILLLMAHQNQSNTSDMGSSLREDPYGTSLLFDSYARAGYLVKRSQDEDSMADQDAAKTTAFFIGGYGLGFQGIDAENTRAADKFRARLEDFLSRGGRVVLVEHPGKVSSTSQDWEVENDWSHSGQQFGPTWISPDLSAMPTGSEMMYLNADVPWLKTDAHWTSLYSGPVTSSGKAASSRQVYMARRKIGRGELVAVGQEWFLLNETIKSHPNPVLLDFLAAGRPEIWVDESLHGLQQDKGVLWLVQRYRLQVALMLFWTALLALLWSMTGDLMRRPSRDPIAHIVRHGESAGVAGRRLLQRSFAAEVVVAECWDQFRRRSPQDVDAISADPQFGPRLRAALQLPPLAGYRELSQLIEERRASAKGLAQVRRHKADRSTNSEKRIPKEEPSA
jgi:hypothetical protein